MGKRGPQPQPAELKKLRGNPGKRAIKEVPKGAAICPDCPADLEHVSGLWSHYGEILARLGILRETDGIAWEMLWRTFDKYIQAAKVTKIGRVKTESGSMGVDPLIIIEGKYLNNLLRLLDRFGMSPTSRGALNIEAPKEADEFTAFLQRKKA
jgi:phage terminase small subunit